MSADLLPFADLVVKVSVLLMAAALAARVLARGSAAARHQIWAIAIAAALLMPALTTIAPQWTIALLPAPVAIESRPSNVPRLVFTEDPSPAPAVPVAVAPSPSMVDTPQPPVVKGAKAVFSLAPLWIAGVALVLARLAFGTARLWWIARRASPATTWAPLGEQLAKSIGLDRRVRFLSGDRNAMPMAWGLLHPRVLLPAEAAAWPRDRQRIVLLHELAHVKRRDCLTQLIAQLACAAYWFNPLVWLAASRLRAEREHACDDLVIEAGTRGSDYADHLLDIARSLRAGAWPTWSAVTMAHRSQLEGRLMAILDPALTRRAPTRRTVAVCAALAIISVTSLAGVRLVAKAAEAVIVSNDEPSAAAAPDEARGEAQGRPSTVVAPAPTPAPMPTPAPTPMPMPMPTLSRPMPAPQAPWALLQGFPDVDIDPDVIGRAVDNALGQQTPQGVQRAPARTGPADPKVVSALTDALKDENKDVRQQALHALVQMRAPLGADVYLNLMKDADADVRQQAVFAIGRLRDPKHIDVLIGALKDSDADVRQQAAFGLGQIRDPRAVDALIVALKDPQADVRQQAAFALGQTRDRRAIDSLIAALKDSNADVRQQAAFALGQIR